MKHSPIESDELTIPDIVQREDSSKKTIILIPDNLSEEDKERISFLW